MSFTLSAEQLAQLNAMKPQLRGYRDPAKLLRREARDRVFLASAKTGLRHSRRTPIYCT